MQAQLRHDPTRGAGYGIIDLEASERQETDILFALRRATDGKYLGAGGWLEAEQRLAPDMVQRRGGHLRLFVGPAVVDMLDMPDTFALTAYSADGEDRRYELEIDGFFSSEPAGGQGIAQPANAPLSMSPMPDMLLEPAMEPQPAPLPSPKTQPAPLTPQQPGPTPRMATQPAPDPEPAPQRDLLPQPKPAPQTAPRPPSAPKSVPLSRPPQRTPPPPLPVLKDPVEPKSKAPFILLLLALACGAGGVYWWKSHNAAATVNASAPTTSPESAAPAPVPARSVNSPSLQRARELLRTGVSPEQAVEAAKSMHTTEGADGAFLLLEDAAQKGAPVAMLGLARFYDPADAAPKGSIRPDPEQARAWYNMAKDKGLSAADDKLKALRAWAEAVKDKDQQAQRLLKSWK